MTLRDAPPIRIWSTIGRAFSIYGQRLGVLLGLAVIGNGLGVLTNAWTSWQRHAGITPSTAGSVLVGLVGLAGFVLSVWCVLAMYSVADDALQQRDSTLTASLGAARGKFWRYLGVSLLLGLIVLGGMILLIVPGIYWAVTMSLYGVIIALEPRGTLGPLRRSQALIKGAFWRTLGLGFAIGLVFLPVTAGYLLSMRGVGTRNPTIEHWGLYAATLVFSAALGPVMHVTSVVWYHALQGRQSTAAPGAAA